MVLYDPQTRSQLQTDQQYPSINSKTGKFKENEDGTIDIYLGPKPPKSYKQNWIQTIPGKGWSGIFRLYGPLEPWFDKSWKLPDVELVEVIQD